MPERPSELADIVTKQDFKKAQLYNLDKSRFGFIEGIYKQVETILMLHYDALPKIWDYAGELLYKFTGYGSEYEVCIFMYKRETILISIHRSFNLLFSLQSLLLFQPLHPCLSVFTQLLLSRRNMVSISKLLVCILLIC